MPSRQAVHLRKTSLARLKAMVPRGCPVTVEDINQTFMAFTRDGMTGTAGRFEVVAAYITGFVDCWKRMLPSEPHRIDG